MVANHQQSISGPNTIRDSVFAETAAQQSIKIYLKASSFGLQALDMRQTRDARLRPLLQEGVRKFLFR